MASIKFEYAGKIKKGTFINGDLVSGKLTVTHNWGLIAPYSVKVSIFNNNNQLVTPDAQTGATNSVEIDLTSQGSISGTWGYAIL